MKRFIDDYRGEYGVESICRVLREALRRPTTRRKPGRPIRLVFHRARSGMRSSAKRFNAMAESIIGLFKTEVIRPGGPWRNLETVEYATLEWVDWFNNRRLLGPIGDIPPVELEKSYYDSVEASAVAAGLN